MKISIKKKARTRALTRSLSPMHTPKVLLTGNNSLEYTIRVATHKKIHAIYLFYCHLLFNNLRERDNFVSSLSLAKCESINTYQLHQVDGSMYVCVFFFCCSMCGLSSSPSPRWPLARSTHNPHPPAAHTHTTSHCKKKR